MRASVAAEKLSAAEGLGEPVASLLAARAEPVASTTAEASEVPERVGPLEMREGTKRVGL